MEEVEFPSTPLAPLATEEARMVDPAELGVEPVGDIPLEARLDVLERIAEDQQSVIEGLLERIVALESAPAPLNLSGDEINAMVVKHNEKLKLLINMD